MEQSANTSNTEIRVISVSKNIKTHTFYKESGKWYIDLPESGKPQFDLEIIHGGFSMLEFISHGRKSVQIDYSEHAFPKSNMMVFLHEDLEHGEGAYYRQYFYDKQDKQVDIWFCDTVKLIFGYFPPIIYFKPL